MLYYKNIVHFTHFIHHVIIFYFKIILSYSRYARASLYRVLEAREKLDTGDENSLIFGMGK